MIICHMNVCWLDGISTDVETQSSGAPGSKCENREGFGHRKNQMDREDGEDGEEVAHADKSVIDPI